MAEVPFLGCRISLISKCDIRYEGILYCVDAKESTIALSKVKSYGTEDRVDCNSGSWVAPKNETYDIIIFRASDVKDLRVDTPEPPGLTDPAIISARRQPSQNNTSSSGPLSNAAPGLPPAFGPLTNKAAAPTLAPPQALRSVAAAVAGGNGPAKQGPPVIASTGFAAAVASSTSSSSNANKKGNRDDIRQRDNEHRHRDDRSKDDRRGGRRDDGHRNRDDHRYKDGERKDGDYRRNSRDRRRASSNSRTLSRNYDRGHNHVNSSSHNHDRGNSHQQHHNHHNNQRSHNNERRHDMRRSGPRGDNRDNRDRDRDRDHKKTGGAGPPYRRGPPQGMGRPRSSDRGPGRGAPRGPRKGPPLKFDGEYDFDEANKEFLELEAKLKNLKLENSDKKKSNGEKSYNDGVTPKSPAGNSESGSGYDSEDLIHKNDDSNDDAPDYYDKTKSFFDNISCEASERSQGKVGKPDWRKERQLNAETFGVSANYRRTGFRGRVWRPEHERR